jgi:hypothetical protein
MFEMYSFQENIVGMVRILQRSPRSVKYMFINFDLVNIQSVFNLSISISFDSLCLYFLTPRYIIIKVTEGKNVFGEYRLNSCPVSKEAKEK